MVYDLIIIGAGQAGLAAAYYSQKAGLSFTTLESNSRVGDGWRQRYDSLVLFSLRRFCALPGLKLSGNPDGYPTKDEVADYLAAYAKHFDLDIKLGVRVQRLSKTDSFHLESSIGMFKAKSIVVATGGFQEPKIPAYAGKLSNTVVQLTAADYQRPNQIPSGSRVLVVGGGNSGAAIAAELANGRSVSWSVRRHPRLISRQAAKAWSYFLFWSRLIFLPQNTRLTKQLARVKLPDINNDLKPKLRAGTVKLYPELKRLDIDRATFADGAITKIDAIIWATGYQSRLSWIEIAGALDADSQPIHHFGISPVPGLYYVGLERQRSLGSALVGGVGRDAKFIIDKIGKYLKTA